MSDCFFADVTVIIKSLAYSAGQQENCG